MDRAGSRSWTTCSTCKRSLAVRSSHTTGSIWITVSMPWRARSSRSMVVDDVVGSPADSHLRAPPRGRTSWPGPGHSRDRPGRGCPEFCRGPGRCGQCQRPAPGPWAGPAGGPGWPGGLPPGLLRSAPRREGQPPRSMGSRVHWPTMADSSTAPVEAMSDRASAAVAAMAWESMARPRARLKTKIHSLMRMAATRMTRVSRLICTFWGRSRASTDDHADLHPHKQHRQGHQQAGDVFDASVAKGVVRHRPAAPPAESPPR